MSDLVSAQVPAERRTLLQALLRQLPRPGESYTMHDVHVWTCRINEWWRSNAPPIFRHLRVSIDARARNEIRWDWVDAQGLGLCEVDQHAVMFALERLQAPTEVDKVPLETEARFEPSFVFLYQIRPELAPTEDDLEAAVLRYFPAVRWQGEHLFTSYVIPKGILPAYIRFLRDTSKDEVPR